MHDFFASDVVRSLEVELKANVFWLVFDDMPSEVEMAAILVLCRLYPDVKHILVDRCYVLGHDESLVEFEFEYTKGRH
jgi:hypothetical protein